jgi:hypothetical protein
MTEERRTRVVPARNTDPRRGAGAFLAGAPHPARKETCAGFLPHPQGSMGLLAIAGHIRWNSRMDAASSQRRAAGAGTERETSRLPARRSMVRKRSRRSTRSAILILPQSSAAHRTVDLRVMRLRPQVPASASFFTPRGCLLTSGSNMPGESRSRIGRKGIPSMRRCQDRLVEGML